MGFLQNYIAKIDNEELKTSILQTSQQIYDKVSASKDTQSDSIIGLLFGNVQSGKTGQILGAIARMADCGYRMFIFLTTDNIDLQRQTYNRVAANLTDFDVLSERDDITLLKGLRRKPVVIVLKKNTRVLKKWRNNLVNLDIFRGQPLVVFDDEGDAASLNTRVNSGRISPINKCISDIRNTATDTIFFEVTATPQAIILQSQKSNWKPSFVVLLKQGKNYLGGNFFYSRPQPFCIKYTDEYELDDVLREDDAICPKGLRDSIMSFLVVCAYKKIKGETNCNFMIHPSVRIKVHNKFVQKVTEYLNLLQNSSTEDAFYDNLKAAWTDLKQTKPDLYHIDDIREKVVEILDNTEICVIPLNSKSFICRDSNDPNALDLSKGFNVVIGGNTLGRGITFPHLQTVYYCRESKTPQADTYWQHSRVFGYDRDANLMRVFIPEHLYKLFSELNDGNEILLKQIENGTNDIQVIYPEDIKPTRKNVLDTDALYMICGGVNIFASSPIETNVEIVDSIALQYSDKEFVEVDIDVIQNLLKYVGSYDKTDFDSENYSVCIDALQGKRPHVKCILIVRTERDIAKGTGTMLSPNDRLLGDNFSNEIVLTLYRVVGSSNKGWNGKPLWMPNIKFPTDLCFYYAE